MPPPPLEPHVASAERQHGETKIDRMDPTMRTCFSYGWDVTGVHHRGMLPINESLKMLHLRIHEPHAPYESLPTQYKFSLTIYNGLLIDHSTMRGKGVIQVGVE